MAYAIAPDLSQHTSQEAQRRHAQRQRRTKTANPTAVAAPATANPPRSAEHNEPPPHTPSETNTSSRRRSPTGTAHRADPRREAHTVSEAFAQHAAPTVAWRTLAACKDEDVEIFFPPPSNGRPSMRPYLRALAICETCTVTEECLQESYAMESYDGVWGGEVPVARRKLALGGSGARGRIRHGTEPGYRAHELGGTPPCAACVAAHARTEHAEHPQHAKGA